jgi:hypothetical protein
MNKKVFSSLLSLALAWALIPSSESRAAIIYEQTFTGGTGSLAGSTPTVENYVGDNVWTAGDGGAINLNGSIQGGGTMVLPFVPEAGMVYTLTTTLNRTGGGSWVGVGFFTTNAVYGFFPDKPMGLSTDGNEWQLWPQGSNTAKINNDLVVKLDTTTPFWSISTFQAGSSVASSFYQYTVANPVINFVGITSETSLGTISAFQLTAIPEPSSVTALAGLGAIGLVMFRRRRR